MVVQLLIGSLLIVLTVVIHATTFDLIVVKLPTFARGLMKKYGAAGGAVVLTIVVLEIFAAHTVEIWLWAMVYNLIGEITDFESALYFSTVT